MYQGDAAVATSIFARPPSRWAQRNTVGNSCRVRLQAARHSAFDMCVAGSQKPMQSAKVLPPPPGALGAYSLGLADEEPGDSARLLAPGEPPPVANCVDSCGESGANAGAWGAGAPIMDCGVEVLGVTGTGGGPLVMAAPLVDDVLGLVGRTGLDVRPPARELRDRPAAVRWSPDAWGGSTTEFMSAASRTPGSGRVGQERDHQSSGSGQGPDATKHQHGTPFPFRQHPKGNARGRTLFDVARRGRWAERLPGKSAAPQLA